MHLNIVSFDIPLPANYGGVIDVFYKIKALSDLGLKIHLHCFYSHRAPNLELEDLCESVEYYKRKTAIKSVLSIKPYIIKSRESVTLLRNLIKNDYPILFEGIHSTSLIDHPKIKTRVKVLRSVNIEHHYYWNLFKASIKLERIYFLTEAIKLRLYQRKVRHANLIMAITDKDRFYFTNKFPKKNTQTVSGFFEDLEAKILTGRGDYALYHGNLSVAENVKVAKFLIKEVFSKVDYPFKIAGLKPDNGLLKLAAKHQNITIIDSPKDEVLFDLIRQAQFNLMITFQATGLKLKLLHSLSKGRFCITNGKILEGTGLDSLCLKANTPKEILEVIKEKKFEDFSLAQITERETFFSNQYSNKKNAQMIIDQLF